MSRISTIKNFANMADNGLYQVESMAERKVQGKSRLVPQYYTTYIGSETEATGFEYAQAFINKNVGGSFDTFSITNYGKIFNVQLDSFSDSQLVHTTAKVLSLYPDLFLTSENNILYPSAEFLGIAYIGQCDADSTSTKIVDSAGRNWTDLGISSSAGYNKVYNITKGEEFTITSVSTTNSTNDSLNFSAGSTTPEEDDYFIVFADGGKDNSGNKWNFFTTTPLPSFLSSSQEIKRQIKQFDTDYLILNGNYIAALNVDESTWNDNFKELPPQTEALCFDVNQDRILVGCNYRGKGRILLWDGYSDGWLSIIETEKPITSITSSDTGFIFSMANGIYLTNGYSYKLIDTLPDLSFSNQIVNNFNQIKSINNNIFLLSPGSTLTRSKAGIYTYEFGKGWINTQLSISASNIANDGLTLGCLTTVNDLSSAGDTYTILSSFSSTLGTNNNIINKINLVEGKKYSTIMEFDFDDILNIKQIGLNLSPNYRNSQNDSTTFTVTANIGDGRRVLRRQGRTKTGSTTTSIINSQGASVGSRGRVGNEIRWLSGVTGGERSYITAIENAGTANETWTISPAISAAPTVNSDIEIFELRYVETKSLDINNLTDRVVFDTRGIYSDKLIVELVFNCAGNTVDIINVELYD